ncbi:hypothetical protein BGZ83_006444 [Gryganskiella cystojenkinii]|nr:hypothetical protein BGZ83_006444 [Gryganskiella cystojenkinii]
MVHKYFDAANAEAFNALSTKTDSHFDIYYFGFHGLAGTVRTILAFSGADFKSTAPADGTWETQYKPLTPFGVMPVIRETSADGQHVLNVAETDAIERYLCRKFGYYGQNGFEEQVINTFVASSQFLMGYIFRSYFSIRDNPELKATNKTKLLSGPIPDWVKSHEHHLSENPVAVAKGEKHGNGHYVGDKVSLADFKTAFLIDMIRGITGEDFITEAKTPAIWKVREVIERKESVKAWKATKEFKEISERNYAGIGFY